MARQRNYLAWAIVSLVIVAIAFGRLVAGKGQTAEELTVVAAERGTLAINVVAMGALVALHSVTIASEIQSNRAKVVRLMPEGSLVKKGDLLIEFDATPFLEDVTKYTRAVKEAEATLLQAQQEVKLQKAKNTQLTRDVKQRLKMADLELKTQRQGQGPLRKQEAKARLQQSEQQLLYASRNHADADAFLKEGFITRQEYEQARARLSDAQRAHDLAMADYDTLVRYRQPEEVERARLNLIRAQSELAKVRETSTYEEVRQEALLVKAETALEAARADLSKAREEWEKAKVFSPSAGFLVYNELPFGSEYRKLQIGDSVWNGQAIMTIPNTSQMAVETFIREFDVHKVQPGQKVQVSLEAFPGLTLAGHVDFIGNLATKGGTDRGGKQFSLRVLLENAHPHLRPGMTAEVEIGVETIADALLLPIEAVFRRRGDHYCAVVEQGRVREQQVQVGKSNSDYVTILAGLQEGQLVSLMPTQASGR
jgi:HlyD family secretion protein